MKRVLLFTSILMMAAAMNAWAGACAKDTTYGAIKVETVDENKCVATLDPESTEDVNIPEDVTIDEFVYDRNFKGDWAGTGNSVFTICLPFTAKATGIGGEAYNIISIKDNCPNCTSHQWQIVAKTNENDSLKAGVPYFIANAQASLTLKPLNPMNTSELHQVKFGFPVNDEVDTLCGENCVWEFRGTYTYKKWEEGDSQIGHVYGFAAKEKENVKAGQFVKVKAGAYIKPMRAYLYYNKQALARRGALAKATVDEDLPSTIEVIFKDKNGVIASIHRMDPVTGAITPVEGWYDMKGRKLDKKPTLPGTYFNNGEKVIIK